MHIVIYQFNFKLNISESILFIFNSKSMQENVSTITRIKLLYDNTHLIRNNSNFIYMVRLSAAGQGFMCSLSCL